MGKQGGPGSIRCDGDDNSLRDIKKKKKKRREEYL